MDFDATISDLPAGWANNRQFFFKYMSAATAKIVLRNRTLRWSAPSQLNDPFDIQFNMEILADPVRLKFLALERLKDVFEGRAAPHPANPLGQLFRYLGTAGLAVGRAELIEKFGPAYDEGFERMKAVLPSVHEEAARIIADTKILCLSACPISTLMWSHYAANHTGVVLRFRSIPELDTPYGLAKPINYVTDVPSLLSEEQLADIYGGTGSINEAGILDRTIYTKSIEWAYEKEWRLCTGAGRRPGEMYEDCPFGREELDGIIFGLRTSAQDRSELEELASGYPSVEPWIILRAPANFALSLHPVEAALTASPA